jgi:opacity protein-like surface antigen
MSLKHRVQPIVIAVAVLCFPTLAAPADAPATGKPVTPAPETWAGGVDVGFANPIGDDDLDVEPFVDGYIEYFFTSNVSLRGMLGLYSFSGPDNPGNGPGDLDLVVGTANVIYQWEGGTVHPFVTGGLGFYDYNQDDGDDGLEFGFNAGGGVNFYLTKTFAIKVEGDFHGTSAEHLDSFFTATGGARWLW